MSINLESQVELSIETNGRAYKTVLRGWKHDVLLLVDIPDQIFRTKMVDDLVCRCSSKGKYYGFTVKWLGILAEPSLMYLSYPEDVFGSDLRKSKRYVVTLPASLYKNSGGTRSAEVPVLLKELSHDGLAFISERSFRVGDKLTMSTSLPTYGQISGMEIVVQNISNDYGFKTHGCRIEKLADNKPLEGFVGLIGSLVGETC